MDDFDLVASGLCRISEIAQLRDKVSAALDACAKKCGNCQHWMKSNRCPRESNVNGMSRGPAIGAAACGKFAISRAGVGLTAQRLADAMSFATERNFPLLSALREAGEQQRERV